MRWRCNSTSISQTAIACERVQIGAYLDDDQGLDSGAAYIFARNQSGPDAWGQVNKLTASDGAVGDRFGNSVAIAGSQVAVGAYFDDEPSINSGSAYVFQIAGAEVLFLDDFED